MKTCLSLGFVLCLLLFINPINFAESAADITVHLDYYQQMALQAIFSAWNNTPDLGSNLAGWSNYNLTETATDSNSSLFRDPCFQNPWRGVFCCTEQINGSSQNLNGYVGSLTLTDASIMGALPQEIWNFRTLTTLVITDNPNLTSTLNFDGISGETTWMLRQMDFHNNNLDGGIPEPFGYWFTTLEEMNLSNNRLNGSLPWQIGLLASLRKLELSNNKLFGNISNNFFQNWTSLVTLDLSKNNFNGVLPNLNNSRFLHTMNFSHNKFNGEISPYMFNSNASTYYLTSLDLSNNNFTGLMPDLSKNIALKSLDLSNNCFSPGSFPTWLKMLNGTLNFLNLNNTCLVGEINLFMLEDFQMLMSLNLDNNNISSALNITSIVSRSSIVDGGFIVGGALRMISMKNNKISTVLYTNHFIKSLGNLFNLQGNPYCNDSAQTSDLQRCVCQQICYDSLTDSKSKSNIILIIIAITASMLTLIMIAISSALLWKNRRAKKYLLLAVNKKFAEYEMKPTLYTFSELQQATRDFHVDMKLGEGAFGVVYKGCLADGSNVAVKQLLTSAQQNMDEFLNEVILLTGVKHRNLVKLKGCCFRGNRRLLVYEYVENYDLAETLFDHKGDQILTWQHRFNICLGIAQGLHYLHALVEPRIIHRDIKANNVLLDKNLQPKIADFGLAILFPNENTHITMVQVAGTKGYLAPEYATLGMLSEKVDVYSFGVLVLEIIGGRRNIDLKLQTDKAYLLQWAWRLNNDDNLMDLVDPTMSLHTEEELEVQRLMNVALSCVQTTAERRPTMAQVLAILQGDTNIGSKPSQTNEGINNAYYQSLLARVTTSENDLETVDEENSTVRLHTSLLSSDTFVSSGTYNLEVSAMKTS